eukprot:6214795-Pleurochrysis_carterae.AAC.2
MYGTHQHADRGVAAAVHARWQYSCELTVTGRGKGYNATSLGKCVIPKDSEWKRRGGRRPIKNFQWLFEHRLGR